MPNLVFEQI